MAFANRYCAAHHNGWGWNYDGASNIEELYEKLQGVMIRRKKTDVLTELPDKQRTFLPLSISNEKEYRKAENNFIGWVTERKGRPLRRRHRMRSPVPDSCSTIPCC